MPNITLSVSEELKKEMEKYSSVRWSSAVRNVIEQKIMYFEEAERIAKKSRFNWKAWKLISAKISKNAAKHAEAIKAADKALELDPNNTAFIDNKNALIKLINKG